MAETYRVLIVDDDPAQAEMVEEYLRVVNAFQVDRVGDIASLWALLENAPVPLPYDILLLDYMLPDGTGLDALAGLRQRGFELPIVMVTGQGDERVAVQAIQRGATDYLLKSGDYLLTLPTLIRKTVRAHQLNASVQRSLEQIRYQATLLNNVRDAIVVWDMEGKITYWNPAAISLFGWMADERLGCDAADVYLQTFNPPIVTPKAGDTIGHHIERQCQNRSGQTLWVSSRITALYDSTHNNRLIGYMDVSHDITKSKEAEQALRSERNFVSAVLDTVGALVVVLDRAGRIVRFNRTCEQITGCRFEEVRGQYLWDLFILPEDVPEVRGMFATIGAGPFPLEFENTWVSRQGQRHLITWANTALTGRGGQLEYLIATGLDVTARRQAEAAVRHRLEVERLIADVSTDFINLDPAEIDSGIVRTLTSTGAFIEADRSYVALLSAEGTSFSISHQWRRAQSGAGAAPQEVASSLPLARLPWTVRRLQQQEVINLAELDELPPEAGAERDWLAGRGVHSLAAVPLVYGGDLLGFLAYEALTERRAWVEEDLALLRMAGETIVNALQRRQMEAKIQAAQTRLTQSARLATLGEMAAGVAHQINNPLSTIIAEAQILLRSLPGDSEGRDSLEAIEQGGWRLQEVVQRLLEFSRPASADLEEVALSDSIRRALGLVGAYIESVGVNLQVNLAEKLPKVRGNARQLEDLWVNLLLLARDAANDGFPHTVSVACYAGPERSLVVEVRDDGTPIPSDLLAVAFEPDFVGSQIGRGTGMELSICREIVRQHGGEISVASDPEHDTIFRINFPLEG